MYTSWSWTYSSQEEKDCDRLLVAVNSNSIPEKREAIEGLLQMSQEMLLKSSDCQTALEYLRTILSDMQHWDYDGFLKETYGRVLHFTFGLLQSTNPETLNEFFKFYLGVGECHIKCAHDTRFVITCCNNQYRLGEYLVAALRTRTDYWQPFEYCMLEDLTTTHNHYFYIKLILRYGVSSAEIDTAGTVCDDFVGDVRMTRHCLCDLLTFCLQAFYNLSLREEDNDGIVANDRDFFGKSIKLVLKATSHVTRDYVKLRCQMLGYDYSQILEAIELLKDRIPELDECVGYTPVVPGLKHLCRCAIRQALYATWALPDGIERLNIPEHLKAYLEHCL